MLEEKEKKEKDMRVQIILDAEDYIREFYEKRKLNVESNKANNREREKVRNLKGSCRRPHFTRLVLSQVIIMTCACLAVIPS